MERGGENGGRHEHGHLAAVDPAVRLGDRVRRGTRLGALGKEGGSGGWSHLHFDIKSRQPSGMWGTQAAYGFVWEAYQRVASNKDVVLVEGGERALIDRFNVVLDA